MNDGDESGNGQQVEVQTSASDLAKRLCKRDRELHDAVGRTLLAGATVVNLAIDQGNDLIEAKRALPHGEFGKWIETDLTFSWDTANNYMKIARAARVKGVAYFKDMHSMREALELLGCVPAKQLTSGRPEPSVAVPPIVQRLNWVAEWWTKERQTVESMPREQLEQFEQKLRPAAEMHAAVAARLAAADGESNS